MRIAVIGPTYPIRGGISHYTTLLVSHLRESHEVLFISYAKQYPRLLFPGRTQVDVSERRIEAESEPLLSFSDPLSWRRAASRVTGFRPDIVLFSWVNHALAIQFRYIAAKIKRQAPRASVVFWCHNVSQHERLPLAERMTLFAFRPADSFIVPGEEARDDLLAMRPGSDVRVAHLPVLDAFGDNVEREWAREALGISREADVALYFGFVRGYKGLAHLLESIPWVLERVPGLRLLVVGEFWENRSDYDAMIDRLGIGGCVTVVDAYVPNEGVASYFGAADLVVLPYTSATGSGIAQIANHFGKPVLTTSVGSLPEIVRDGQTGFVVPPSDPAAIAEAMSRFFEEGLAAEYSLNVERARERFSWRTLSEIIESCR